jgi:hypothetical protein
MIRSNCSGSGSTQDDSEKPGKSQTATIVVVAVIVVVCLYAILDHAAVGAEATGDSVDSETFRRAKTKKSWCRGKSYRDCLPAYRVDSSVVVATVPVLIHSQNGTGPSRFDIVDNRPFGLGPSVKKECVWYQRCNARTSCTSGMAMEVAVARTTKVTSPQ